MQLRVKISWWREKSHGWVKARYLETDFLFHGFSNISAFQEFFALMSIRFISRFTFYNVRDDLISMMDQLRPLFDKWKHRLLYIWGSFNLFQSLVQFLSILCVPVLWLFWLQHQATVLIEAKVRLFWRSAKENTKKLTTVFWTGAWWGNLFRRWPI